MSKKRTGARKHFATTADGLIHEIAEGKWEHTVIKLWTTPIEQWKEVVEEFSVRCPGHTREEYVEALRRSYRCNR